MRKMLDGETSRVQCTPDRVSSVTLGTLRGSGSCQRESMLLWTSFANVSRSQHGDVRPKRYDAINRRKINRLKSLLLFSCTNDMCRKVRPRYKFRWPPTCWLVGGVKVHPTKRGIFTVSLKANQLFVVRGVRQQESTALRRGLEFLSLCGRTSYTLPCGVRVGCGCRRIESFYCRLLSNEMCGSKPQLPRPEREWI